MAPIEKKLATLHSGLLTLAQRLEMVGVVVPDQAKVAQMMEAIRLGLGPNASTLRIRCAVIRRYCTRRNVSWQRYRYQEFLRGPVDPQLLEKGGIHPVVQEDIERVFKVDSRAIVFIKALRDDPWPLVVSGNEALYLRGWMGDKLLI